MKNLFLESGLVSINKEGESLCGDFMTEVKSEEATTVVLSDGLGSGVKANILATLTSKILSTMIASHIPIEESVYTMAKTLPICSVRKLAYATFTILHVEKNEAAYLAQFDNPGAILLRDGRNLEYPFSRQNICGKEILETRLRFEAGDVLVLLTDGVTHAGLGKVMPDGWDRADIIKFLENIYRPDMSPKEMATGLTEACRDLYLGHPDDDTTAAVFKLRERQVVNLMIGPPEHQEDDEKVMKLFFSKEGKHVACGGTTAKLISRYLKQPILPVEQEETGDIPAISKIKGMDLVTEGVITLGRVIELVKEYRSPQSVVLKGKPDGASQIASLLCDYATDINFFVGRAFNPSHTQLPISHTLKMGLLKELVEDLETMGKKVKVSYC